MRRPWRRRQEFSRSRDAHSATEKPRGALWRHNIGSQEAATRGRAWPDWIAGLWCWGLSRPPRQGRRPPRRPCGGRARGRARATSTGSTPRRGSGRGRRRTPASTAGCTAPCRASPSRCRACVRTSCRRPFTGGRWRMTARRRRAPSSSIRKRITSTSSRATARRCATASASAAKASAGPATRRSATSRNGRTGIRPRR